jgi:methionyl-tRNA formyltransferase
MRLIMMGTGPFAVPTFRALCDTRHDVTALVTAPLRLHRGAAVEPSSSIRLVAEQRGTPILDPADVNLPQWQERLAKLEPDLLLVCDYGQILSPATLAAAHRGGVNLHASLLPKYRGAAPINWAIYHGETETGVSVIHMTPRIDAGPLIAQARLAIEPDETAVELEGRLAELGARLTCETIDRLEAHRVQAISQEPSQASKAPRLKKTDGLIDWSRSASAIKNHIRAMVPWPQTYTYWHRSGGEPLRLILGPASVVADEAARGAPGVVLEAAGNRLLIAAGSDAVLPSRLQPVGKRMMAVGEFLRGYHVRQGDRFGAC